MPNTTTPTTEDQTKDELLAAIRTQTEAAAKDIPRNGAAALRDLAEAYSLLTAMPLPLLGQEMTAG